MFMKFILFTEVVSLANFPRMAEDTCRRYGLSFHDGRRGFFLITHIVLKGLTEMPESKIAVAAIIIEDLESARAVNEVLHKFNNLIVGRLGIPYRERGVNVISVVLDGSTDDISALTGQLGKVESVTVKAAMSKK